MNHLQPKTLNILLAVLSIPDRRFSQKGIWELCNRHQKVSAGQVNKVIRYLERVGFVERTWGSFKTKTFERTGPKESNDLDMNMENGKYILKNPIGLLDYISLSRDMKELRFFTFEVSADEPAIIAELSKSDVMFCLGTALERYSSYYRPDEISFYTTEPKKIFELLKTAEHGRTNVVAFRPDILGIRAAQTDGISKKKTSSDSSIQEGMNDPLLFNDSEKMRLTSRALTVMDMFCDQKGAFTKTLAKQMWGIEI